nr:hypothetical protein [Tanacetum cinerariifolium]
MEVVEVPQTLEYRGGQLNAAHVLEVENFTNWKKSFMCHSIGIEPYFKNIIKNGPFIPMTAGQRKPENQWTGDERKATNLDQQLKSLIMSDFQDSPDDEEHTRSSHEYLNDLEEEYQARDLLAKSKRFFKKVTLSTKTLSSPQHKPKLRPTKDFEAKYKKFKAKLALLSLSASASKASMIKNKSLIAESYEWDEEEVSSNDNEMMEVKVLMELTEENDAVSKEGTRNCEWTLLSEAEGFILPNHDTGRILPAGSQRNTTDPSVAITDSSVTIYDLADESSVCTTLLLSLKKLDGAKPISGPKTIKSILRTCDHAEYISTMNMSQHLKSLETERYPPDEYLHPYEPSQRYQTNNNDVSFIEPYEYLEPVVLETKVSSNQNGQTDQDVHNDQNDQSVQNDEILNDDHSEHSNHTNDDKIIDNLPNTKDI